MHNLKWSAVTSEQNGISPATHETKPQEYYEPWHTETHAPRETRHFRPHGETHVPPWSRKRSVNSTHKQVCAVESPRNSAETQQAQADPKTSLLVRTDKTTCQSLCLFRSRTHHIGKSADRAKHRHSLSVSAILTRCYRTLRSVSQANSVWRNQRDLVSWALAPSPPQPRPRILAHAQALRRTNSHRNQSQMLEENDGDTSDHHRNNPSFPYPTRKRMKIHVYLNEGR